MKYWRRHWYEIGGIIFVALSFFMGLWGSMHMSTLRVIMVYGWMAMLVHQFEEYAMPGGFPSIGNMAAFREKECPDRYPFNQQQCFVCNVFLCYTFYIITIIFPDCIWLGSAQVCCGFLQLLAHGIIVNRSIKSFYNPGLGATVFLQIPLAVYYFWYVITYLPDRAWQLWLGIPLSVVFMVIVFIGPVLLWRNRDNHYPFDEEEMFGYRKEKILQIYHHSKEPSIFEKLGIH